MARVNHDLTWVEIRQWSLQTRACVRGMKLPADGSGQANERALPLKQPASTKGWHIELVLRRIPRNQTSKSQRAQARRGGGAVSI